MKPVSGRILIRRKKIENKTASGIILPGQLEQPTLLECTVVAVASDSDVQLSVGEVVFVEPFGVTQFKDDLFVTVGKHIVGIKE